MTVKGLIFDLDGVIVFTDQYHYKAWKQMADEKGIYFDQEINNRLRGVSRMESLEIILERYEGEPLSDEDKQKMAEEKNEIYKKLLEQMTPADVSDEVKETLDELRKRGYLLSIGSSSKNAKYILERTGIMDKFDAVSDGTNITRSKPDPEVFLKAAEFLGLKPEECGVVEDAYEGIDAAVDHLYTLGHKKIAFLNGSLHSMVSEQRQEAYYNSMKAHGLEINEDLTAYGYYVADSAKYHVPTFLGAGATAIICGNDLIASGVITECKLRGFRVPEDISVVGFDDIPISSMLEPPLTTIRQERSELGKCAYVILNSLVHHIPICRTQLRAALIERESTARYQAPVKKQ